MRTDITIPVRMQSLPVDKRGYPIPFFVGMNDDNTPNFKYASVEKLEICFKKKLCGCCGKLLTKREYYYVGGMFTLRNGVSTDAPMHKNCAEFAMQACPHMFYEKAERTVEGSKEEEKIHIKVKPDKLYLMRTADLIRKNRSGHWLFEFRPNKAWLYTYTDNKLGLNKEVNVKEEIRANEPAIAEYITQQGMMPSL